MTGVDQASGYAEIGITTNFSFLRGGSHPQAYVQQAAILGVPVIGIADHNTLAGVVRAFKELDNPALKFYSESPECPHKGDPEHVHLAQPKS